MSKYILVANATGNQGRAVLAALRDHPSFTLLAATRDPSTPRARAILSQASNIRLIHGTQDDAPSLLRAANEATKGAGVWGVYSVQISLAQPNAKGASHEGEVKQGEAMVDAALSAGVKHFVYGSVDRGGEEKSWENPTDVPHFATKWRVERYLRDKAKEGGDEMGWTVLRPTAFMDMLEPGLTGKSLLSVLKTSMGERKLQWVASRDIGVFAGMAFKEPEKFNHKAISLAGDDLNYIQMEKAIKETTGQDVVATWGIVGYLATTFNAELRSMMKWFVKEGYGANVADLKKMHPGLMDLKAFLREESGFAKQA